MEPTMRPRVKICCIGSIEEAWTAIHRGASALGLVSDMPSGPGVISEDLIAQIADIVPPGVSSFLLTSQQDTISIITQQRRLGVNTIQICDRLESGNYEDLHNAMPGIGIVQAVHVAPHVDAILLDSGNQSLSVKELGGTGRTHNWNISRTIRESVSIPIFLAGGLEPQNVVDAIKQVGPFGVDVCNGVRTNGRLDEAKLSEFFRQVAVT